MVDNLVPRKLTHHAPPKRQYLCTTAHVDGSHNCRQVEQINYCDICGYHSGVADKFYCSTVWRAVTDVSEDRGVSIFTGQAVQEYAPLPVFLNCLTLEMKADRPFETSGPVTQR
jgi:hypothetical protein